MTRTQLLCAAVSHESKSPGKSSHPPPFAPKTHPHAFPAVNCLKYFYMKGLKFSNVLLEKAWGHNEMSMDGQKGTMCDSRERRHLVQPSRHNQHARTSQYSSLKCISQTHRHHPQNSACAKSTQLSPPACMAIPDCSSLMSSQILVKVSLWSMSIDFVLVLPLYVLSPSASSLTSYGKQSFSVSVFEILNQFLIGRFSSLQ